MKKLSIVLALLLTLLTLFACGEDPQEDKTIAYKPILDEYRSLVLAFRDGQPLDYDAWEALGFVEVSYYEYKEGNLGYALKDINGDGVPELLLLDKEGWGNPGEPSIYVLYTLKDGKPVMLGQYWSRSRGHLAADGTIYTVGSSSAFSTYLDSYQLEAGAGELTHLTEYYTDIDDNEIQFWVKVVDGREVPITEAEFDALVPQYETPASLMNFDFIPIEP